jgi:hypothetical protein
MDGTRDQKLRQLRDRPTPTQKHRRRRRSYSFQDAESACRSPIRGLVRIISFEMAPHLHTDFYRLRTCGYDHDVPHMFFERFADAHFPTHSAPPAGL